MKKLIAILACSFVLVGCSQNKSQQGMTIGGTREDVMHQLEQVNAKMLTNTPEMVRAEFKTPDLKNPMQVEVTFLEGKVRQVNYFPQF